MPIRWYVCPYDRVSRRDGGIGRRCAMARHIPVIPNALGARWREIEILGNHCIVKVDAPLALLTTISADSDFREIPVGTTVPAGQRAAVQARLEALGYTAGEITGTGWIVTALRTLIAGVRHEIQERPDQTGFIVTTVRRPPAMRLNELDSQVPG